jgi:hypothetical protein
MAVAGRKVGEKVGNVGALRVRGATMTPGQEGPELKQVGSIGRERVAGQPPFELQVGEEVEHERLEARFDGALAPLAAFDRDSHSRLFSAA